MVGIDIIEIIRMQNMIDRYGDRFLNKVFTDNEIQYVSNMRRISESLAGRFAAKEAFIKALGRKVPWKLINVLQSGGKPYIEYLGERYDGVSISHERAYAVSVVVI
ncbi:MAG: holo-ACP synthase [Proteobacteria bacterium]|nr:holo-ACP synthase [Pseudomonadota bacterium]